jgi:hypothetical protein
MRYIYIGQYLPEIGIYLSFPINPHSHIIYFKQAFQQLPEKSPYIPNTEIAFFKNIFLHLFFRSTRNFRNLAGNNMKQTQKNKFT